MVVKSIEAKEHRRLYQLEYYYKTKDNPIKRQKRSEQNKKRYLKDTQGYIKSVTERLMNMSIEDLAFHRHVLTRARSRAKKYKIEFTISASDVKWNTICPVLGLELVTRKNKGKGDSSNSLSLDRIDSAKGYIPGNVRSISNRANKLKNNMTKEECELILESWDKI